MKKPMVLLADEDGKRRRNLRGMLRQHDYEVIESSRKIGSLRFLHSKKPDLIVVGSFRDNSWEGLRLARELRQQDRQVPIILIAGTSSEDLAIAALKAGVTDYFRQPFLPENLLVSIGRCLASLPCPAGKNVSHRAGSGLRGEARLVGQSEALERVKAFIQKAAMVDCAVLISGETGTGKELAAELIHQNSPRRKKPLVLINCAAIPEPLVESELFGHERGAFTGAYAHKPGALKLAEDSSVLLDEIGDMSLTTQAKILRVLETKEVQPLGGKGYFPVNIRVMAATNQNLEKLVDEGRFRLDLYYRLNVARLHLPPLRERREDIAPLLHYYLKDLNRQYKREVQGFSEEVLHLLYWYAWPGNVRELKNLVAVTLLNLTSPTIGILDLPELFRRHLKGSSSPARTERERILATLRDTRWNKSETAQKLRWSRMTLYRKMAKYQIPKQEAAPAPNPTPAKG